MSDNYPFDRHHWLVAVSFPISRLAEKDALYGRARALAESRGGRDAGSSEPAAGFIGKVGHTSFGLSFAFEAGDVNAHGFAHMANRDLGPLAAPVMVDEDEVFAPEEPEPARGPGMR